MPSLVRVWISFTDPNEPAFFKLGLQPVIIGRDSSCQIQLNDPSVSRNHASIAFENGHYILHDNGSINGTLVNGEPVRKHQLQPHDTIRFGEYVFVFEVSDLEGTTTPSPSNPAKASENTAQQPIRKNPVAPQKNQPVKVIIGKNAPREGKHPSSRTIPLRPGAALDRSRKPGAIIPTSNTDFAFISFACGCAGPIAFIPAILFGHVAEPVTYEQKKNQQLGLVLGYFFLSVWLVVGGYYLATRQETPAKGSASADGAASATTTALEVPRVNNALDLLRGTLAWAPPSKVIGSILGTGGKTVNIDPNQAAHREAFFNELRSNWTHGLIVFQPDIVRPLIPYAANQSVRFVIEDFTTKPTFWEYNSTVVPEKKTVVGPFIMPTLREDLFFDRDTTLTAKIPKFNDERFPWHNAQRGIQWNGESLKFEDRQASLLRWVVILKASTSLYSIKIDTLEGNLTRDEPKEYIYSYHPAEYLAQIVYLAGTEEVLALKINPDLFNLDDMEKAKRLLHAGFKEILARKPQSTIEIGAIFRLPKLEEIANPAAPRPPSPTAPATPAPATPPAAPGSKRYLMP